MFCSRKILFIERYRNDALGPKDQGKFVTLNGNVYNFDLVDDIKPYVHLTPHALIRMLKNIVLKEKPSENIDEKAVQEAYDLVKKIDRESKMIKVHTQRDAGQTSLITVCDEQLITISTTGDTSGLIDSKEVDKILNILDKANFYKFDLKKNDIKNGLYSQCVETPAFDPKKNSIL